MDLGDGNKSLVSKLPPFTGRKEDFVMRLAKFTALATMGSFSLAIARSSNGTFGEADCPADEAAAAVLDPTIAGDRLKIAAWNRNNKAFAALALCMPNKLFRIIAASAGSAATVMKLLYHEYKPDDNISRVEAERKYAAIKLQENGNPRYLSQRFAEIAHQHPNAAASDAKMISIILAAAPTMYQSILATQQIAKGAACTAEDLIEAMEMLYRQRGGGNSRSINNHNSELAMAAPGNRAPKCWNCNKPGHKSSKCRAPSTNNKLRTGRTSNSRGNNRGTGDSNNRYRRDIVCNECGLRGHLRERCFCLNENASKRPANWKPPAGYQPSGGGTSEEQGQVSIESNSCNGYELLLCQIDRPFSFPQHLDLLRDPNIWIGDTGASTHSTPHMHGLINMQAADKSDGIRIGNNQINSVKAIGDLPGTFYDKHGN
jgi:gag-polypeptide of LTR copia-type